MTRKADCIAMDRHFTATAYIVENSQVLLIPHPKIGKWLPPGGHLEVGETPPECACREAYEETGLMIEIIPQENLHVEFPNASTLTRPYLCLLENIPPHGQVPAHQHIDFIYLARPLGGSLLPEAKWFSLVEVEAMKDEKEIFRETKTTIRHILTEASILLG